MNKPIKSFKEFINESYWGDMMRRSSGETIRKEEGKLLGKLGDGTKLILSNEAFDDGKLVDFDGENVYNIWGSIHIAIITDGDTDYYYAFDKDKDLEDGDGNMTKCFEVDSSLRTDYDFKPLKAIIQAMDDWDDDCFFDMNIDMCGDYIDFEPSRWLYYKLFFDKDGMVNYEESMFDEGVSKEDIDRWINLFGNDFLDEEWFKDAYKESMESYYDDLDEEDAIDELLRWEVIEDSEEYFGLDEDGEIDHTQPKFDYQDYRDKYVENVMDEIDDFVDEYVSNFGSDELKNHIDTRKLAELCVERDYEEMEVEVDGDTYYIYNRRQ